MGSQDVGVRLRVRDGQVAPQGPRATVRVTPDVPGVGVGDGARVRLDRREKGRRGVGVTPAAGGVVPGEGTLGFPALQGFRQRRLVTKLEDEIVLVPENDGRPVAGPGDECTQVSGPRGGSARV